MERTQSIQLVRSLAKCLIDWPIKINWPRMLAQKSCLCAATLVNKIIIINDKIKDDVRVRNDERYHSIFSLFSQFCIVEITISSATACARLLTYAALHCSWPGWTLYIVFIFTLELYIPRWWRISPSVDFMAKRKNGFPENHSHRWFLSAEKYNR